MLSRARLCVQQRVSPWVVVLPFLRLLLSISLVVASLAGVRSVGASTLDGVEGGGADKGILPSPIASDAPRPSFAPSPTVEPSPEALSSEPLLDKLSPVTNAGADQLVKPGTLVVLDGSLSYDPKGTSLAYSWRQIDGPRVDLNSPQTAAPSFTAGLGGDVYIFSLTVRDINGLVGSDTMVVATRKTTSAPIAAAVGARAVDEQAPSQETVETVVPRLAQAVVRFALYPTNIVLFALSLGSMLLVLFDRIYHLVSERRIKAIVATLRDVRDIKHMHRVRVVHYQTNEGIAGARVTVLAADGAVVARRRTNLRGAFTVSLNQGSYTVKVAAKGFAFSPAAATLSLQEDDVLYAGGQLNVTDGVSLAVVVPMKPTGETVGSLEAQTLAVWQIAQRYGHRWSWPIFVIGAVLNTALMLWLAQRMYLGIELFYVGLVLVKILLEVHLRPSYGLVRDAFSHVPIGLAVVRLHERGTNRLVLTRVTDNQGKFFALPPSGVYNVVVSKPGYATFTKDNVPVSSDHDTTLRIKVNLMPVVPQSAATVETAV